MNPVTGASRQESLFRARLEHCRAIFDRERERKELLEKKSQFYLSFATVFLGALLLNLDFIRKVEASLVRPGAPEWACGAAYTGILVYVLATFTCLFAVLLAVHTREYLKETPQRPSELFFATNSPLLLRVSSGEEGLTDEDLFIEHVALSYARAYEDNSRKNDRKSAAVQVCAVSVFFMMLGLAILVSTLTYLELTLPGGEP